MLTATEIKNHLLRLTETWQPVPGYQSLRRPTGKIGISGLAPEGILNTYEEYDFWMSGYPWGLTETDLLYLEWTGFPGLSSTYNVSAIQLSEKECLYFECSNWEEDYYSVLALGTSEDLHAADRELLQALLESNGKTLGTGVIGSPPPRVSFGFPAPADFWAGLFVLAFDAADAWEGLCEEFPDAWERDEDADPDEEREESPEETEKRLRYPGGRPSLMNMSDGAILWVNPEACAYKMGYYYWGSVRTKWRMVRKYLAQVV